MSKHPGPDLAEPGRLHAVLVGRPAGHGVEADVRGLLPLEHPGVGAVVLGDDAGRLIPVPVGDVSVEHVGRLDHVIVDRDQDQIVDAHVDPLRRRTPGCTEMGAVRSVNKH